MTVLLACRCVRANDYLNRDEYAHSQANPIRQCTRDYSRERYTVHIFDYYYIVERFEGEIE